MSDKRDRRLGETLVRVGKPRRDDLLVYNDSGVDLQRGEIANVTGWKTDPTTDQTAAEAAYNRIVEIDAPATYRNWLVLVDRIPNGEWGRARSSGLACVRLQTRDLDDDLAVAYPNGFWVDVHPDPAAGTRQQYHAAMRTHGGAYLLDRTDGFHADYELGLIDLDRPRDTIEIVAKETFAPAASTFTAHPLRDSSYTWPSRVVDEDDELTIYPQRNGAYALRTVCGIGGATFGSARWNPMIGRFVLETWPETFRVELVKRIDSLASSGGGLSDALQFVGDDSVIFNAVLNAPGAGSLRTWNGSVGDQLTLHLNGSVQDAVNHLEWWVDAAPIMDDPYCTIRARGTGGGWAPGWKLCDGTDGAPDLTDKFLKGSDNNNTQQTGGSLTHEHSDHARSGIYQGSGSLIWVTTGYEHNEVSTSPPYYTVSYWIRLQDT